jgi:hypothetical protein
VRQSNKKRGAAFNHIHLIHSLRLWLKAEWECASVQLKAEILWYCCHDPREDYNTYNNMQHI